MGTIIYQSNKMQISWDSATAIFEIKLMHQADEEEYLKTDLLKFIEITEAYRPKKNLWNLQLFGITISIELQEWIDSNINSRELELGIKYEAFITSDDLINQISVEQTMDETHGKNIVSKFFNEPETALHWLNSHH